ncbi:hypothetical protein [Haloarcula nitratireducens]|uniref:Uncharacterized protein n=1 Tax=Haloarcula nitratireducens TaxID=2487749 RepID=A0AAW4P789_9EURY|nr:hypothetical protein [Halomicroarcula nitratireducens]MBX0293632.1 hypothetical protein [Halomicroarcula nitratireducens]
MGGDQQTFGQVVDSMKAWIPQEAYDHERKFQSELQDYLDTQLNENQGNGGMPALGGMGQQRDLPVSTERGKSRADVVVDDVVGIELKRDLTNSQRKKLDGQIKDYLREYPYVIVCACGIQDIDGWRRLKNEYEGSSGFGMEQQEVVFIHKRKENYGKSPSDFQQDDGGFLGDGSLF